MDIYRVRYFQVFADVKSLVKAAEILSISQPALSKSLKTLQDELGVVLIEPDGRGLRLTEAGEAFRAETAPLLAAWNAIPQKIRGGRVSTPTRIGSFEVFTTYFLSVLTQHVDLGDFELHEHGPGKLELAIADGAIDVGITYVPIPRAGIDFIEVTKIKMGTFGLKKYKAFEAADLPFVTPLVPAEGAPSKVAGLDGWPDHKFPRQIRYRVSMMESAMELCRQGLAVAYLPEFIVRLHNALHLPEFRLVELANPVPNRTRLQSVFLVKRSQSDESSLHRQIAKGLRTLS